MAIPKQNQPTKTKNSEVSDPFYLESQSKGKREGSGRPRRLKTHETVNTLPRSRRRTKRNKRKKNRRTLFLTFFLSLIIAGLGAYLYTKNPLQNKEQEEPETPKILPYYEVSSGYTVNTPLRNVDIQKARNIALSYFNSADATEASKYILGKPQLFEEYYQPLVKTQAKFGFSHGYEYTNGAKSAVFKLSLPDQSSIELHTFAHPDENFRVDWKSQYLLEGNATLGEVKPSETTQRVKAYITPNGFYPPEFPKDKFQSLLLQSHTRQIQFPAFVEKSSDTSKALAKAFQITNSQLGNRLMLRATISIKKHGKGYIIKDLYSSDWTNLETFDSP